jgi:carbamoyl-phosphate synthase large subunit
VTPFNVLITAASRRVPLVQAFRAALAELGLPGAVIATDVSAYAPAVHMADRAYRVPLSTDPAYLEEILALCGAEGVRLVVPTIDDELPLVGAARARFAAIGAFAACSSEATALTCNDKALTCARLIEAGIPAARTYLPEALPSSPVFPLFIKPRTGRGAVGAHVVRNSRELAFFRDYVESPIVQEYLDGPEYTIDVLCDTTGRPLVIVPRERVVIRAGVIDRGRTVKHPALLELAERVCAAMPFVGPINIQCRMRGPVPTVFEINPRFSGGIPLTIAAGADVPALLIQMAQGVRLEPTVGRFQDDLWIAKYEAAVFLPSSDLQLATRPRVPASMGEVA